MSETKRWASTSSHGGMVALVAPYPPDCYVLAADHDAEIARLTARLAQAEALLRAADEWVDDHGWKPSHVGQRPPLPVLNEKRPAAYPRVCDSGRRA